MPFKLPCKLPQLMSILRMFRDGHRLLRSTWLGRRTAKLSFWLFHHSIWGFTIRHQQGNHFFMTHEGHQNLRPNIFSTPVFPEFAPTEHPWFRAP